MCTNLATQNTRREELNGKTYTVVPMVLLTEGVHAGSDGPMYYPREELAKTPAIWNMKPVVVYHPAAGESATDPDVARRRQVGMVMNAHWRDGKLRAEAWLEDMRVAAVDARIATSLSQNQTVEISTGLFTDRVYAPGRWGKEYFDYVATNYRPDHVAILPDTTGACSVADGCGLLRNNAFEAIDGGLQLPLPTMNFASGTNNECQCQRDNHDNATIPNWHPLPTVANEAATGGNVGPLPLPQMGF